MLLVKQDRVHRDSLEGGGARQVLRTLQGVLWSERVPVIVLDWGLRVVGASAAAEELLARLGGDERWEQVRAIADEARDEWHAVLLEAERPGRILEIRRVLTAELAVRVTTQPPGDRELGRPTFRVVLLTRSRRSVEEKLGWLALLGSAELAVVREVCRGRTNQAVAESVGRSLATVKAELAGAFRKLGVANRAQLVAEFGAALDVRNGGES